MGVLHREALTCRGVTIDGDPAVAAEDPDASDAVGCAEGGVAESHVIGVWAVR